MRLSVNFRLQRGPAHRIDRAILGAFVAHRRINRLQLRVAIRLPRFLFGTVRYRCPVVSAAPRAALPPAAIPCPRTGSNPSACSPSANTMTPLPPKLSPETESAPSAKPPPEIKAHQYLQSAEGDSYTSPVFDCLRLTTNEHASSDFQFRFSSLHADYCVSGSSISDSCRTTITIPESVTWNRRLSASTSYPISVRSGSVTCRSMIARRIRECRPIFTWL